MRNVCRTLTISLCAALLAAGTPTFADADARSVSYDLNIPSEDLTAALQSFAIASHHKLLYKAELTAGKISQALKGHFTAQEAMETLLSGTGLSYEITGSSVVLVKDQRDGKTSELSEGSNAPSSPRAARQASDGQPILFAQADQGRTTSDVPVDKSEEHVKNKKTEGLEEIVVTGTHIRGIQNIASPTLTITREDIDQTGYQTVEALVASLPQNFNALTTAGAYGAGGNPIINKNTDNATGVDLRGLGPQSTLTLVDGQRVAGSIQGRVADVSMIPLSMIDHVDVVTGGASAIYGADAVGGVANFVLRHSYNGADTQVYFGGTSFGGDRLQLSQIFGRDFEKGGFMIGYDFARESQFDVARTDLVQPLSPIGEEELAAPIVPDNHRHSVYLTGHFDPAEGLELFADASYAHKSQNQLSVSTYPSFSYTSEGYQEGTNDQYGANAGLRLKLGSSWRLSIVGAYSRYDSSTSEVNEQIFSGVSSNIDAAISARSTLMDGSVIADGNFISAFGVQSKAALGIDVRRETLSNVDVYNPALGFNGDYIPTSNRVVRAFFGEINIPLVEHGNTIGLRSVDLSISARDDHYSDFGNTFNPQASLIWQPFENLTWRSTYAKAFRAPDLYTLHQGTATDLQLISLSTPTNPTPTNVPALFAAGGNPGIQPERAKTWSTGLDYQLPVHPVVKFSLSYFDISYDNRINSPLGSSSQIISSLYPASVLVLSPTAAQAQALYNLGQFTGNLNGIPWNGNPATLVSQIPGLILFDDRNLNVSTEKLRGVDLIVDGRFSTVIGEVNAGINATRTLTHYQQITAENPPATIFNYVGEPVGLRARANTGLTYGPYGGFIFVNYTNSYTNQFTTPISRIGSWTTVDLTLRFDSSKLASRGALSNVTVTASAQNLLDRNPPLFQENNSGFLFDPANANPFGRFLSLNVAKKW